MWGEEEGYVRGKEGKTESLKEDEELLRGEKVTEKWRAKASRLGQPSSRNAGRKIASQPYLYPLGLQPPPGTFHLSWEYRAVNNSFPHHKPFFPVTWQMGMLNRCSPCPVAA